MKKPSPKRKPGRPKITDAVLSKLLEMISEGMTMSRACRKLRIGYTTVHERDEADPGFNGRLTRARVRGAWFRRDKALDQLDKATSQNISVVREALQQARYDCSKLIPRTFGDRLDIQATIEDKQQPRWAMDLYNITPSSPPERQLVNWPREDKFERARRLLSDLSYVGHELEAHWGIPDANETVSKLIRIVAPMLDRVVDGKPAVAQPTVLALSAPAISASDSGSGAPDTRGVSRARDSEHEDAEVIE